MGATTELYSNQATILEKEAALNRLKELLKSETKERAEKNTPLLLEASDLVRQMNGGRVTFCKSGKDRTAMSVTLDQMRRMHGLGSDTHVVETFVKPIANVMREYGVRIDVACKNIGSPKYSFNSLQRKILPKIYRPPLNAISGVAKHT